MDREFNLIDEPWICVRDNGCEVKEISIRQVFEHAQDCRRNKNAGYGCAEISACDDLHSILEV